MITLHGQEQLAKAIEMIGRVGSPHAEKAAARAMNRSINSGRVVFVRGIAKAHKMKQPDVRKRIAIKQASPEKLEARLYFARKGISLTKVGDATGPYPSRGKGGGVMSKVFGQLPHAFIATMPRTGHSGVFQRTGLARLPIKEIQMSISRLASPFRAEAEKRATEQLAKNMLSELRFQLRRIANDA